MKSFDGKFHRASNHNVEISTSTGDFIIMRFQHEYDDLRKAGFTKSNREPSYKVSEVCDNFVKILNIYNEAGMLTDGVYTQMIDAYRPFLRNYMTYETLQKRVDVSKNPEGWLDA